MKRIISLFLVVAMMCSLCVPVSATEMPVDEPKYSTEVTYNGEADNNGDGQPDAQEAYTVAVPALLAPGDSGTVTLSGTWASNRTVTVTASENIDMVNSINENDVKELDVIFYGGIKLSGSNTSAVSQSKDIAVEKMTNALFGTWEGLIQYQVSIKTTDAILEGDGQTFHKMAPSTLSFRSMAPLSEFKEVQINGQTVSSEHYTLEEGSTIVTLNIDYLDSLDVTEHEITVVSESSSPSANFEIIEPELNEYGFYYNQPYTAYVEYLGGKTVFFLHEGGILDFMCFDTNYAAVFSYTANENTLTITTLDGIITANILDNGNSIYCTELDVKFILNPNIIAADEDYIYFYNEDLNGYEVSAIDKTKSEYIPIKTDINNKPTVKLANDMFYVDIYGNTSMVKIPIIPESITEIGEYAFCWCKSLTSVVIPKGVTKISYGAFYNCNALTNVTIPKNVTIIEESVFGHCPSLTNITFNGTTAQWNAISFGLNWNSGIPATEVVCSDGVVSLN